MKRPFTNAEPVQKKKKIDGKALTISYVAWSVIEAIRCIVNAKKRVYKMNALFLLRFGVYLRVMRMNLSKSPTLQGATIGTVVRIGTAYEGNLGEAPWRLRNDNVIVYILNEYSAPSATNNAIRGHP